MKILVDEIPQSPKEIKFSASIEELNEVFRKSNNRDFLFPPLLVVDLVYYRLATEIFFNGRFEGQFTGCCGRCLENYWFDLDREFEFVLTPDGAKLGRKAEELHREDLALSYYSTEQINLTPLIAEQVILALPTRPLCAENCRGLCGSCGVNLNVEACGCSVASADPRMAIFRTLKISR
jgi:uncharacterized protein